MTCSRQSMLQLRRAALCDFTTVLSWITSADTLKRWGGPLLRFPPDAAKTWREIEADEKNSFVLVEDENTVVGFAQVLQRTPKAVHLARIILAPEVRGKRFGRMLLDQLIQVAIAQHQPAKFTLNVYQDNSAAIALYRGRGFVITSVDSMQGAYAMELDCSIS